jgi:DNA gyrase/topoisomerase IV subunit A
MAGKKGGDDNQPDLFGSGGTAVVEKERPAVKPPAKAQSGGGGGTLPPHFAPLSGEYGDALPIGRYASTQYLQYAIATVKDRALPRVGDGQKPVQGRILYSMWDNGTRAGTKRTKSAAVVGEVLGKFHPHGDQSVYDALVRLAQDFTMRYPLIDGEGNFGSRDGDEAAAYRYTEARLTRFADVLLAEIGQGTVDFLPNYDGTREEPVVLPSRLPVVLLNGASGIAVGMATEIPSHNLNEVAQAAIAMIRDPEISVAGLMRYIKGPDFPGGGQIITPRAELKDAYTSGRGSVRVRARWTIERLARGQWQVVVHELPPGTSTRKVREEIDAIVNPQPRAGKKSLTPEQQREKQLMLSMLDAERDESDRNHAVRLVLEPKSSRVDETEFINLLLAKTSLESNAPINMVMVGLDGRPTGKNLRDLISEWVQFRLATVTRRTQHKLTQVLDRIHVLEGRMIVLLNVDKVIKIIRAADEPQGRSDQGIQAVRAAGRRHSRHAAAPARQARALRGREGARRKAQGAKGLEKDSRLAQVARRSRGERDRRGHQDLRRQAPHQDRGSGEGRDRDAGDRRAGHGDLLAQGLGARAAGVGSRSDDAVVQGRRRAADLLPVSHGRSGRYSSIPKGAPTPCRRASCRPGAATASRLRRWSRCRKARTSCTWWRASLRPT